MAARFLVGIQYLVGDPSRRDRDCAQPFAGAVASSDGLVYQLSNWVACMHDFSPFAFASTQLERQYHRYQSAHAPSHIGPMCWVQAASLALIILFAWHNSIDIPRLWLFKLAMAVCVGAGVLSHYSPAMFGVHWRTCCFLIRTALMVIDNDTNTFVLTRDLASGKLHAGLLVQLEAFRLVAFIFLATAFPISLPAAGFALLPVFLSQGFSSASKYQDFQGLHCQSIPGAVTTFGQSILLAHLGQGVEMSRVVKCQVGLVFWKVQTEMIGAVFGVLRDIASRRFFLRAHPQLIGQTGAACTAAWPLGSSSTVSTCISLMLWLTCLDVMAVNFWVSGIVGSQQLTP